MADLIVGVDVGGTNTRIGLVDMTGDVSGQLTTISTDVEKGPQDAVERIAAAITSLTAQAGPDASVGTISLVCPGPLDRERGIILNPPNLDTWKDFAIVDAVAAATSVKDVILENDANAAALGEYWRGSGRGTRCMLMLTLGTGVGGGVVLDGRLWSGPGGVAGELGHFSIDPDGPQCGCGNRGCLEAFVSAAAIERRGKEAAKKARQSQLASFKGSLTPKVVHELAVQGDDAARKVLEETGRFIGIAVAGLVNIFNPDMVVLGGGVAATFEIIAPVIKGEIDRLSFSQAAQRVLVLKSALGDSAGVIGAAAVILQREGGLPRPWHIERIVEPVFVRALHVGRTGTEAAIAEIHGDKCRILSSVRKSPQAGDKSGIVDQAMKCAAEALGSSKVSPDKIWGTGLSTPGPLDRERMMLRDIPGMGWKNTDLSQEFAALGRALFVEKDADAAALAELKFGAGRGASDFVVIYLGSGIGAGIVLNSELYRGFSGTAGEIGHHTVNLSADAPFCACGNRGCLEFYAGGAKLVRDVLAAVKAGSTTAVSEKALSDQMNHHDVWQEAENGDVLCQRVLQDMGRILGIAIANYLNLMNAKKVIVAGPLARAWQYFEEPVINEVNRRAFRDARRAVTIEPTTFGEDSDMVAAAAAFAEQWRPGA